MHRSVSASVHLPDALVSGFVILIGALCLLFPVTSSAQVALKDRYVHKPCRVTPGVGTSNYPGFKNVMTNNKLALPPGKAVMAPGQPVYFYARVFDSNCVPVTQAHVELWQADPSGRHRYATKAALATPDPTFAGAGRTSTTNLGEFTFMTLYPGPYEYTIYKTREDGTKYAIKIKRAPHFNIKVTHPDLRDFSTNLFFEGDARNAEDHILKQLSDEAKGRLMMKLTPRGKAGDWNTGIQATIDITLPSANKWREF